MPCTSRYFSALLPRRDLLYPTGNINALEVMHIV